ncbi:uncharacterized protein LACBIDRAFT_296994 [Laccaria bicolor S238N-H82]|uniref:Predicted protein n=1 Tax=Laccaria bicolor (strain S238N-H82 / ATCC MYA-4686) TaxID=486041 RepID=B0D9R1_LACBS|nr:uncharacterized protein LACBIDRAFT_296994 [Laccaria bicolor S238N-H82]EDR08395.1 predicted protein [Laccaria bicolor S238N-H82]|eukprot:XP_001880620.1 predicted protein [Laccaria bicolor S238N-H82]
MPVTRSPRKILGVSDAATADEIKHAYRTMALKWHPDRHNEDKERATRRFVEVNNAYRTLAQDEPLETQVPDLSVDRQRSATHSSLSRAMSSSSSEESSRSSSSVIHIAASSAESLITPPSSHAESVRPFSKQGQRKGPMDQFQRSTEPPNRSRMPAPSADFRRQPPFIPANRSHDLASATSDGQEQTVPVARNPQNLRNVTGSRRSMPFSILPPSTTVPQTPLDFSLGPPRTKKVQASPYNLPLPSLGVGSSGASIYSLSLSLEDLMRGKHFQFSITRRLLSGRSKSIVLDVDIPPGCRIGTKILCRGVGNEARNGTQQDIVFVIDEAYHQKFKRVLDDLIMDIRLPWSDTLPLQGGYIDFAGLEGRNLSIYIDYPRSRSMKGVNVVTGAGMPIREGGSVVGRGNLTVRWEIFPPPPKIMQYVRKVWHHRQ